MILGSVKILTLKVMLQHVKQIGAKSQNSTLQNLQIQIVIFRDNFWCCTWYTLFKSL